MWSRERAGKAVRGDRRKRVKAEADRGHAEEERKRKPRLSQSERRKTENAPGAKKARGSRPGATTTECPMGQSLIYFIGVEMVDLARGSSLFFSLPLLHFSRPGRSHTCRTIIGWRWWVCPQERRTSISPGWHSLLCNPKYSRCAEQAYNRSGVQYLNLNGAPQKRVG